MRNFNTSTLEIVFYFGVKSNNDREMSNFNNSTLEIVVLFWIGKE